MSELHNTGPSGPTEPAEHLAEVLQFPNREARGRDLDIYDEAYKIRRVLDTRQIVGPVRLSFREHEQFDRSIWVVGHALSTGSGMENRLINTSGDYLPWGSARTVTAMLYHWGFGATTQSTEQIPNFEGIDRRETRIPLDMARAEAAVKMFDPNSVGFPTPHPYLTLCEDRDGDDLTATLIVHPSQQTTPAYEPPRPRLRLV